MKCLFRRLLVVTLCLLASRAGAVELIGHPDLQLADISRSTARSIFTMRMTSWPNGLPIRVFVLGDKEDLHTKFSKRILGVFPHQLRRAWNRQIFSGTGQAPEKVADEQEMLVKVQQTPGAIGYISEEMINEQIRTIAVE